MKISAEFNNTPTEHLCLIYAGKMLKEHENFELHAIKDNMTVHLVIKNVGAGISGTPTPAEKQAAASRQAIGMEIQSSHVRTFPFLILIHPIITQPLPWF